ncbi:DUF5872 domain-containing protein [Stutzerimonas stutzeri]|uniref:DUF5872 domain-containing protein n=1 Tax=Stutzerimonas stutzeri TaxID=316 RepID=UPI001C2E239B|nr:DUF5872 domain-containing protein [Stutzerimonas stutzeri]
MSATAKKTDPKLWERVKQDVTRGDKGGEPGQWSARKAQYAVQEYKKRGGGYEGGKAADNQLREWTREDWGTQSGKPSGETGERYLPKHAREALSDEEYARTTRKKRADARRGQQHSKQPVDVADKTRRAREPALSGLTKPALMRRAAQHDIRGRSTMKKAELIAALERAGEP